MLQPRPRGGFVVTIFEHGVQWPGGYRSRILANGVNLTYEFPLLGLMLMPYLMAFVVLTGGRLAQRGKPMAWGN